jgi:Rieske Fe-S protein
LGTSFGALCASIVYPLARFVDPPEVAEAATNQIDAGPVNDPELVERGFKILPFGNDPVILVRVGEEYRAFGATCTHLDCTVEFRADLDVLWCNCHNGRFDLTGQVAGGPPPKPLRVYDVHLVQEAGRAATLVIEKV